MMALEPVVARIDVRRTMDAAVLNELVNDPAVREALPGSEPLDLSPLIDEPGNLAFYTGPRDTPDGALLLIAIGSGRYDVHSLFRPEARGRQAYELMRDVADFMFAATDCTDGRTTIPEPYRAARVAARRTGFRSLFTSPIPWGDAWVAAECLTLTLDHWALEESARTEPLGAWFHAQLEAAKHTAGSRGETHPHDPIHDRAVGAAGLMMQHGQPEKAVRFYNIWAACAHYASIALLRTRPIVVDLRDAIVEVRPDTLEVLRCR